MKLKTLSTMILCVASTQVLAEKEYWFGTDGEYARDRNGHCVRTILWTPEAAIAGCESGEAKTEVKPEVKPEVKAGPAKKEPVAASPAIAATPATVVAAEAETAIFNLSSGATFEHGGSTLSAEGKAEVAALVSQFKDKTVDSVVIEGHTDSTGDASFNQQLSEKRAEAVKAEAVAQGASADKITTLGYGESKPIADNATRVGRAKNRRVEIRVGGIKQK